MKDFYCNVVVITGVLCICFSCCLILDGPVSRVDVYKTAEITGFGTSTRQLNCIISLFILQYAMCYQLKLAILFNCRREVFHLIFRGYM
jgi:hypothetical protein